MSASRRTLLGTVLVGPLLAACGGDKNEPNKPGAGAAAETIRFTMPGNARLGEAWQPVLDLTNKTDARIKLEFTSLDQTPGAKRGASYREQLEQLSAGGNAPDVAAAGIHEALGLQAKQLVVDLSGFAKARKPAEVQLDDFWPDQLEACRVKGALYALPWQCDPELLFFNQALFAAKGVKSPRELMQAGTWTWQTFVDAAQRVAGAVPAGLQAAVDAQRRANVRRANAVPPPVPPANPMPATGLDRVYGTDRGSWETWVWSEGGEILDASFTRCLLDSADATDAIGFMAGLTRRYEVAPSPQTLRGTNERALFDTGRMGMLYDTRNAVPRLARLRDGAWDAVPVPKGKLGAIAVVDLTVFAVLAVSKVPAAAFEAIRFLTSTDAQRQWAKRGEAVPSRKSAATSAEFMQYTNPTQVTDKANASFLEAVQKAGVRLPPLSARWPEIKMTVNRELRPTVTGDREAAAAAKAATAAVEQLLAGG